MKSLVKSPRLRFRGKSMSKFAMASVMGNWHSIPWDKLENALSYDDFKAQFLLYCEDKGLTSLID